MPGIWSEKEMKKVMKRPQKSSTKTITTLFPTQIYSKQLIAGKSSLLQDIREEALMLSERDQEGIEWCTTNYLHGYTSYASLDQLHHFSEPFRQLKAKMDPAVAEYLKALGLKVDPREIQLTRLWANVMGKDCHHSMHIHPLSVISGTVYIQTPPGASAIRFEDPRLDAFMARPLATALRGQKSPYHYTHNPVPGEIVLFESWIRHEVVTHQNETPRISISFNYDWVGC